MERAAITMPFLTTRPEKLGFGLLGLLEGQFRGDRDVSVQFGIELLDAGEHQLGELDGREFAFAEEFSDFLDGCEGQVGVVHKSHIKSQSNMPEIQARHRQAEEHTSELQSPCNLVCRLLLEKKNKSHESPHVPGTHLGQLGISVLPDSGLAP